MKHITLAGIQMVSCLGKTQKNLAHAANSIETAANRKPNIIKK